jgi:hypothetical protein
MTVNHSRVLRSFILYLWENTFYDPSPIIVDCDCDDGADP